MNRFICGVIIVISVASNGIVLAEKDTYLTALASSHANGGREDSGFPPTFPSGGGGGYDYGNNHVRPVYGPPPQAYGPPQPGYGVPQPGYGPPGPSGFGPSGYGVPYYAPEANWLLDKFKIKLDLFTVGKILLKLIIFKKIVKFLALICLLLFLPKLKHDKDPQTSTEENFRNIQDKDAFINERVNVVTNFAITALKSFSQKHLENSCGKSGEISCRFERMFDAIDKKYPYERIVKLYSPDTDIESNEVLDELPQSIYSRKSKQLKQPKNDTKQTDTVVARTIAVEESKTTKDNVVVN